MEHITKKILQEQFITRYPLTYPSIKDGRINYISESSLLTNRNANYGAIPLGVNEALCDSYGNFSSQMKANYEGKVLPYSLLASWYKDFKQYYELLYSNDCRTPYSSATDYCKSVYGEDFHDLDTYTQIDETIMEHGGEKFYKWLKKYYFISIDFKREYFVAKEDGIDITCTYTDWVSYVENLDNSTMYYTDVYNFYNKMMLWHSTFGEKPNINDYKDNEKCQEYVECGGYDMCKVLGNWIQKEKKAIELINTNISENEDLQSKLIPETTQTLSLKRKIEDLGNYSIFCSDYVLGKEYHQGNVVIYKGKTYVYMGNGQGYLDDGNGNWSFDTTGWVEYTNDDFYYSGFPVSAQTEYEITGRTVSSLESFKEVTYDDMGNELPGAYHPNSNYTLPQPVEGQILELKYKLGKTANVKKIGEDSEKNNIYCGDVLVNIVIYYKDNDGTISAPTLKNCTKQYAVLNAIGESSLAAMEDEYATDVMYCDFIYYKGTKFQQKKSVDIDKKGNSHTYDEITLVDSNGNKIKNNDKYTGIMCIEHCTISLKTCTYCISDTELYPIKYYEISRDREISPNGNGMMVAMTDFKFYPYTTELKNTIAAPGFRSEELLGFSLPETVTNNIYLSRGYATAIDRHLKLGEVSSLETLERYGNGSFSFINDEEEN